MLKTKRMLTLRSVAVAAMMLLVTLVGNVFVPSPAAAGPPQVGQLVKNTATNLCLAMDYKNAYVVNCGIAGIDFWWIETPDGYYLLEAHNTGLCLSNFDYFNVYPANCDIGSAGQEWFYDGSGSLYNRGTGKYLLNDSGSHLTLIGSEVDEWSMAGLAPFPGGYSPSLLHDRSSTWLFMDNANAYMSETLLKFNLITLPDGYMLIQGTNTGKCLSNFDYFNVYATTCNIYSTGQHWALVPSTGALYNVGTNNYLFNDYGYHVALSDHYDSWQLG